MWLYLRDVIVVIGILLIVSGIVVGWGLFVICAFAVTYAATLFMGYQRGTNGETK